MLFQILVTLLACISAIPVIKKESNERLVSYQPQRSPQKQQPIINKSRWEVQLPLKSSFKTLQLQAELDSDSKYCKESNNAIHLITPADGGTSKSSNHPRTELRQQKGGKRVTWSTGKGKRSLTVIMSVDELTKVDPFIAFTQIKLEEQDKEASLILFYKKDQIYAKNFKQERFAIAKNLKLGVKFTFKVLVDNGIVSVFFNDLKKPVYSFKDNHDTAYFKVGNYMQAKTKEGQSVVSLYSVKLEGPEYENESDVDEKPGTNGYGSGSQDKGTENEIDVDEKPCKNGYGSRRKDKDMDVENKNTTLTAGGQDHKGYEKKESSKEKGDKNSKSETEENTKA